ncbi:MAG: transposase domain-containing protein [Polaromonas sp.]|nr:transposase domain-containing protein [Polaromonas sp.]
MIESAKLNGHDSWAYLKDVPSPLGMPLTST